MNRPTVDIDELLYIADEACAEGDYSQAVTILRKAAAAAPLRRDIRNRLALALERSPVTSRSSSKPSPAPSAAQGFDQSIVFEDDDDPGFEDVVFEYDDRRNSQEAIGEVARKAFRAAAGTTAKAGQATQRLTNLLNQGIKTWKSSLLDQARRTVAKSDVADREVSEQTEAGVFTFDSDLDKYIGDTQIASQSGKSTSTYVPPCDAPENERVTAPASQKSTRTNNPKKNRRPTDVEDVLAAGIDGFIETVTKADRKKIAYGIVFTAFAGIFIYACFDATRKFPEVETIPGANVAAASLGALDLQGTTQGSDVLANAATLVTQGKRPDAITLLKESLASGKMYRDRDAIRVELAALLNNQAEDDLRNSRLADSVKSYKEALVVLPGDKALQLRLANALYYQATMGATETSDRKSLLSEANALLDEVVEGTSGDINTHRLKAMIYEAQGEKSRATAAWTKVRAEAPEGSPEQQEAISRLK